MVKILSDYPVTFPYGATDPPYSPSNPHHGEDRACPTGTPIKVSGKLLGYSGNTGFSSGPHCHIDKKRWIPLVGWRYFNPKGWSTIHGRVTFVGDAGTAGKMVEIKTIYGSRFRWLHMSSFSKKVGDRV